MATMIQKVCENCGLAFERKMADERFNIKSGKGPARFCSRTCKGQYKSKHFGYEGVHRKCKHCGSDFTVEKPCVKTQCCSGECAVKLRLKDKQEEMDLILPKIREYRLTHSLAAVMEEFGFSQSMLSYWGIIGPDEEKRLSCPSDLTDIQQEIITGNLLGDGSLTFLKKDMGLANSIFNIGQKLENADYINSLFDLYWPYSSDIHKKTVRKPTQIDGKVYHDLEHWSGEYAHACVMRTIAHPVFTALRVKWYTTLDCKGGDKIVPPDIRLTWRTAAFWACDDGCNVQQERTFTLHTDCFTPKEVEFLIDRLKYDLDVVASLVWKKGKPLIKMYGEQQVKFVSGIRQFIPWQCFSHKCLSRDKVLLYRNNTSGVRGVSWHKTKKKWIVQVKGKEIGSFSSLEEATGLRENYLAKIQSNPSILGKSVG